MDKQNISIAALKAEASALEAEAKAAGKELKHGHALELVARNHGFASWRAARAASPIESDNFGSVPTSNAASDKTTQELLPYSNTIESWVVRRNDDAPLRFKGLLLGQCEEESHNNGQYARTTVYRSVSGKYIAEHVLDDNSLERPIRSAAAFSDPTEMVAWLRDSDGRLCRTKIDALSAAAKQDDKVDGAFGEDVD